LQSKGIDRTLLLKMPADNPPPGMEPGEIVLATGSIYGTYDAGRTWYTYSKGIYASNRFRESPLEKSWYIYRNRHGVVTGVMHAHVDDILVACNTNDKETMAALESIRQKLHMTQKEGNVFTYCGKRITQTPTAIYVDQWAAAAAVETISMRKERQRQTEDPLTADERTSYRSVVGQMMYLQTWTRSDMCAVTSLAAQKTEKATIGDILSLNKAVLDM
jgi:hypothetical protein